MPRNLTRWTLTTLGLTLTLGGAAAMWRGWDIIQVERGWSLFIGGAVALSGGLVIVGLAEVVARLDRLLSQRTGAAILEPAPFAAPLPSPPAEAPPQAPEARPVSPAPAADSEQAQAGPANIFKRTRPMKAAPLPREAAEEEPKEIERYQSNGVTYVMFSDGAVEVQSEDGVQRYASLAELRAQAAQIG